MSKSFLDHIGDSLFEIQSLGLYKFERQIVSPQAGRIDVQVDGTIHQRVVNLCANNYLGLADDPRLIHAAKQALETKGLGLASVRFICGTQEEHKKLEQRLARFLGKEDAILFAACFDANGGLFDPLLTNEDAIISDALNHASIIDGIRLCKAKRYRYANSNMIELEARLVEAKEAGARFIMIATDGVFSMDGHLAKLPDITALADKYGAIAMVDDCHATGFIGPEGRGTPAHFGVSDRVDIITGTLGKALGGSMGGYVAGAQPVIDILRQRSRPYLFSNSLPPMIVAAGLEALDLVERSDALRKRLFDNTFHWRSGLEKLGFDLPSGEHPIVPVMLGEAKLAQKMATLLFKEGVFVTGFFFPVVPRGKARIRTQMSASLDREDLEFALAAFEKVGKELGVVK